ncbi:hypothetical protein NM208_g4272 [Fusarium decemcellulare]|uniref:Uncharacterized protein n=1 Tax=Fusarium decemcellulare TaxID=57161 RepID=A0ACC1SL98_9HYPO|nr:hypothetical protein NM208_g4272 [Fusarium decemcellulare]
MTAIGFFIDIAGLSYRTGDIADVTSPSFEYSYEPGEGVTFAIGNLVLGSCVGKAITTVSDLVPRDATPFEHRLVNRARLLFSLNPGQGFEQPVSINTGAENVVNKYASDIDLNSECLSDLDEPLKKICMELGLSPNSIPHTRNHLRREASGFKVLRDLQIQSPDGGYVLSDVYLPLQPNERFPVLVSCTLYGRRVPWGGPDLGDQQDIFHFEQAEDHWHSTAEGKEVEVRELGPWQGNFTTQRGIENIATLNAFSYVPHGYAMVKIDPRGVSQTPGASGRMKPQGLKSFVPFGTDIDPDREATFIGGVPSTRYMQNRFAQVRGVSSKWPDHIDVETLMQDNTTYNAFWEAFQSNPGDSKDIPCFLAASQIFMIHGWGAYEAWMARSPTLTHLQVVDCGYYSWASQESAFKILQFLNHHLKTTDCAAPEPVRNQMRLGEQGWYWRKERNWPVPGTRYTKWYLNTEKGLSTTPLPTTRPEVRVSYPACSPPTGKSGISFHSPTLNEDTEMAGHFVAALSISSSAPDADIVVMLWAVDASGVVVAYGAHGEPEPLAKGFLRASHRKTDPKRSLPWRPFHTPSEADLAELRGKDHVVGIEVEMMPAAARIKAGWSLRLDICPSEDQPDIPPAPMRHWYGETQGRNAIDAVHVGGNRVNFIQCPVVPTHYGYPNCMV